MHAVLPERLQPGDQLVTRQVEPLVDVLQPFGVTASTPDQRAAGCCAFFIASRNVGILGRFHRDLREEHQIVRQPRRARSISSKRS